MQSRNSFGKNYEHEADRLARKRPSPDRLYLVLQSRRNHRTGKATMSYAELAAIMKVSDQTIRRYINNLADIGDITFEKGDGRGNRTVFGFPEISNE